MILRVHDHGVLVKIKTGGVFSDRLVIVLGVVWCHRVGEVLVCGEEGCTWLIVRQGSLRRVFDRLRTA